MSDRRLLSAWTIRGAAGLLLLVIALSVIGAVFEHFAEEADSMRLRPNGQMIAVDGQPTWISDVRGRRMHRTRLDLAPGATSIR
jgi:hypothetical protein